MCVDGKKKKEVAGRSIKGELSISWWFVEGILRSFQEQPTTCLQL